MTDKQENELSMAKAVQQVLQSNSAIVQSIPAFQAAATELDDRLNIINDAAQIQTKNITGNAEDKEQAGKEAIDAALAIIGPAKSFARVNENNSLYQALNYCLTDFRRNRDSALINTLTIIRDAVQANGVALEDYGITTSQINEFTALINTYSTLVTAPRTAITAKTVATKSIAASFKALKSIIKRLDGFVEAKKKAKPDFYNAYKSARIVINNRGKSRKQTETLTGAAELTKKVA